MLSKKAGEITNTRVFAVSFSALKHLELQSFDLKTTITHNNFRHCRVRFSSFARQPFSKQLYADTVREALIKWMEKTKVLILL